MGSRNPQKACALFLKLLSLEGWIYGCGLLWQLVKLSVETFLFPLFTAHVLVRISEVMLQ